jgi:hypothetical protein
MARIVIDIESDALYPYQENTWVICLKNIDTGERLKIHPFKESKSFVRTALLEFISSDKEVPTIIGHNFLGFDGWVLWKDFDLELRVGGKESLAGIPVIFFDTLFASQFLHPDREGKHSLESWGDRLGYEKIDYYKYCVENQLISSGAPRGTEFSVWSEYMDTYCERDCDITERVFGRLYSQLESEKTIDAFRLGQKNFFLMEAQSFTGFKFDEKKAVKLKAKIEQMIDDLKKEVEPELPPRGLKKSEQSYYMIPARPFKKDGSLSSVMESFIEKHNAELVQSIALGDHIKAYNKSTEIVAGNLVLDKLPMSLEDQVELKNYFLSIGWEPTLWNFKKGKDGKPVKDKKNQLIKTTPKIQENQVICPNLLELDGELPKKITRFLSLRNRLGVLSGWLEHPRLKFDGRLPAGSSGLASTHRQRHTTVVNVPKAQDDVLLGHEFRSLFTVEDGMRLIGCDQAALEARCEAHWVYRYEGGPERANDLIFGDLHSKNAKVFFPEETLNYDIASPDFSKDDIGFKKYRSLSKNGAYCLAYGGSPKKLASTLRKSEHDGKRLYDLYWENNPSLKALKDKIEYFWERQGGKKWIPGIDKRRLHSRSKHSLVNLLFQSTGAVIVDYAVCLFDMKMGGLKIDERGIPYYLWQGKIVKRVGYFHDEIQIEAEESVAEDLAPVMEWCMEEAGRRLKLNIPLVGESKIGINWKEVH